MAPGLAAANGGALYSNPGYDGATAPPTPYAGISQYYEAQAVPAADYSALEPRKTQAASDPGDYDRLERAHYAHLDADA